MTGRLSTRGMPNAPAFEAYRWPKSVPVSRGTQPSCRCRGVPRTAFMQGQGNAPHSLHAGAGGCPARPSCRGRGVPRTAFMLGQGAAPHNLHAGSGGCHAQPSRWCKGCPAQPSCSSSWRNGLRRGGMYCQSTCKGIRFQVSEAHDTRDGAERQRRSKRASLWYIS